MILKKSILTTYPPRRMMLNVDFALQLRKYTSRMNLKKYLHNTTFSVQLPYITGHSRLNIHVNINVNLSGLDLR